MTAGPPLSSRDGERGRPLARGDSVGRYLVLDRIGAGGMGSVYAAYDPELDRRIALKTLHTTRSDGRPMDQKALVREAKAMARLSHPNVVTVHDVLEFGDQVLLAMELVEGESLRAWLERQPRSDREIVEVFAQAGRGLAAAHAAGIVHRDFKPDNVLVGADRRVRVADFGLAQDDPQGGVPVSDPSAHIHGQLADSTFTTFASLRGTPRFMAPEQFVGERADARTDQFAFCVSLWGALFQQPPFEGDDLLALIGNVKKGKLTAVRSRGTSSRLREVLARGLANDPASRYASMGALLEALEHDPRAPRRRNAIVAGGALLVVAAAALGMVRQRAEARGCRTLTHRLDGVWDAQRKGAVHDAFTSTRVGYAEDAFARTGQLLDRYAENWGQNVVAACEAGRGAEPVASRRDQCFGERLTELKALADVLTQADRSAVEHAVQAARQLPDIAPCNGPDPLGERPVPSDPVIRAQTAALEEQLRVAETMRSAGQTRAGVELATRNVAEADRIGFAPLTAEALLLLGQLQSDGEDRPSAEATLRRATLAAESAGASHTAVKAWLEWAHLAAERSDWATADERFDFATAWADRLGDQGALRGELLLRRGERLADSGAQDAARELHLKALALLERTSSDLRPLAIKDLGIDADTQGRYPEARDYYARALAEYERLYSPDHPTVGLVLNDIGQMECEAGNWQVGTAALERALHIAEGAFGPDDPRLINGEFNLALVLDGQDRPADALPLAERALASADKTYGPDHPSTAFALSALVNALTDLNRPLEAIDPAVRELAIRQSHPGNPVLLADAMTDLAFPLVDSDRDVARGRALLVEARALYVAAGHLTRLKDVDAELAVVDKKMAGGHASTRH
jgi:eukaryotic-like serine/threonine-protein kinase